MSKKRTNKKNLKPKNNTSRKMVNAPNTIPIGTMIVSEWNMYDEYLKHPEINTKIYDFSYRNYPFAMEVLHKDPSKIISNIAKKNISEDADLDEANKELEKQQKIWNDLSYAEKAKRLKTFFKKSKFNDDVEKLWEKNYQTLHCHKAFFGLKVCQIESNSKQIEEPKMDFVKKLNEYKVFINAWVPILSDNKKWLKEQIKTGVTTRNTIAAYSNLFTNTSLTNLGSSYFNFLREVCLSNEEVNDVLVSLWPKILEYIIIEEKQIFDNIQDLLAAKSLKEFSEIINKGRWNKFWNLSFGLKFKGLDKLKSSKFETIKKMIKSLETKQLIFPRFNEISEIQRYNNYELVNSYIMENVDISTPYLFKDIIKDFGEKVTETIRSTRNLLLFKRKEIKEIFLRGSKEELKFLNYWLTVNTDKSLLAGIFMLRDVIPAKDRKMIIEKAIEVQIARNTKLLSLDVKDMFDWMILGVILPKR